MQMQRTASVSPPESIMEHPIVNVETATTDGHSEVGDDAEVNMSVSSVATPSKKARTRPVSEQMLGRSRPKAIHDEEDGKLHRAITPSLKSHG